MVALRAWPTATCCLCLALLTLALAGGASAQGITPPSYGCRKVSVSVNVRSSNCASSTRIATLPVGAYVHYTGKKYSSSCGDKYTWVQIIWNNAVRYVANADPATGQSYLVYCPLMRATPSPYPTSTKAFINSIAKSATDMQRVTNVPASVTIAQAILESGWGGSTLAAVHNNLFGIKGSGNCGTVSMRTQEYVNGQYVWVTANFRKYCSKADSIMDHGYFFLDNSRYQGAMAACKDARAFARAIAAAGYATSPTYASSLINLMDSYNLYKFDLSYA